MVLGAFSALPQGAARLLLLRVREGGRHALAAKRYLIKLSPAVLLSASASFEAKRDEVINLFDE